MADQKVLKKALASRDFYEDGASSCLPNSFVPRHRVKPSSALEEALEFRRRQKAERTTLLEAAREQSAKIEADFSPERIAYEVKHAQDERDEEVMVGKFMRGEHWVVNEADVQRKELDREESLFAMSAQVIQDSKVMRNDFESQHIGRVNRPSESVEERKERERQSDYIHKINGRIGLFDTYKNYLAEVARLQDCVNDQEEEAVALLKEVELCRTKNDFQWQLDRNNRVKELRAKTAVDLEDLEHAKLRMSSTRKEINIKFPEMSSALLFEDETVDLTEDVHPDDEDEQAFRDTGKSVFGWIIGRLTRDGKVCSILFGQFSREVQPPLDSWIFVGKNIDRNLITTETMSDSSISASLELASVDGVTSTAESDHVLTEPDMRLAMKDIVNVTPVTLVDSSHKASTGLNQMEHLTYQVSGCSIYNINGKYMENGEACRVPKYRNLRGWSIYRVALLEIPDLGILAENCYSALKGPSISVMLDKKSDIAFGELVDRKKGDIIKEGSVHFKRRFAEMSRSGQRIINMDQTSQLYRNEEIRAQARSESDRMMMMILQAVSSHHPPENEDDENEHSVPQQQVTHTPTLRRSSSVHMATVVEEDEELRENDGDFRGTFGRESPRSIASVKSAQKSVGSKSRVSKSSKPGSDKSKDDSDANMRSQGYVTGVDLEIKVTISKGINLQVGSQGFPLARRNNFLAEEAELTSLLTKCIEAREEEVFKLRVESEKVARAYLESHSLIRDMDVDGMCVDIFRQMRKVREATILTSETLGAWARLCFKEKKGAVKRTFYNPDDLGDPKSHRTYCVSIAHKGQELYPQSKEMKSQSARWSRNIEKAKILTKIRYIGEFKSSADALDAFHMAVSKLQPEQLLEEDAQGAKPVVGLRSCGKHFLVRSNAVPNNLPCECCRARELAQPDLVVPSALEDSSQNLQQFIWHGQNYLEKMWSDMDFLDENVLLKKAYPDLHFNFNPLLLLPQDFAEVLKVVSAQGGKVLEYLKGRQEQVRDAKQSGTIIPKFFTDHELMGLPFRTKEDHRVDLDREAAKIEQEKKAQHMLIQSVKSFAGIANGSTEDSESFSGNLRPPLPVSPGSELPVMRASMISVGSDSSMGLKDALPFTPWSTLSPRSALESPEVVGRLLPGGNQASDVGFSGTEFRLKAFTWLEEDHLDFVGKNRLMRSLHILGQSTTLTKHKIQSSVVPDNLKESILKRKKILRSSSTSNIAADKSGNQESSSVAVIEVEGYGSHGDDKVKTIPTEVGYLYRGAFFATAQMRPPVAHRIDDVWCRTDVGEWKGMSKGRAMRSYEFGENVRIQGILKNEERKRLQMLIRKHIERDIVHTDVPAIKDTIVQAKEIRGSILSLDVIQAEQFLKYRVALIKSIRKMQKLARGCSGRRRVRRMKEKLNARATKQMETEIQSIALSRKMAPMYISEGIAAALPKLTKTRFRINVNFGGVILVLTVRKNPRCSKRGFILCPSCNRKDLVQVYDRSKKMFRSEPAACTCRWWQGEETWSVQLFDPITRGTKNITLTMPQVLEHIEIIDRSKPLMDPDFRQKALVGKSFDRLRALFDASFVTFDGILEHSNSLARRRAAEESCILPLLPRSVSNEVLDAVCRRWHKNLAIDRVLALGDMQFTEGPLAVSAIDHIEDSYALQQWEPISDFEYAQRHKSQVKHHVFVLETRVKNTQSQLEMKVADLKRHVKTTTEWDRMFYEDARTTFIRLDENIKSATEKIERVMKYSKEGIANFELEEKNEKLDWKQSYDDIEEGNAWEGLNNRRKLESKWAERLDIYQKSQSKLPGIFVEHERLELELEKARADAKKAAEDALKYAPTLQKIDEVLSDVKRVAKASIKNALAVLTMPRKHKWPEQRRVQRSKLRNVFIRDPFVRAQKENISLWNLLERSVMALRPILKSFTGKAVLRCIVEIYQDPVTKWVLVRINQEEKAVEESMQHIDMHISKQELSDMTNSALDTDILLRPKDVEVILSKPYNWPATHLQKESYLFRGVDCFVKAKLSLKAEDVAGHISESESVSGQQAQQSSDPDTMIPKEEVVDVWIPPSKRPRSLQGVKVFPVKNEKYSSMPRSYATRRSEAEFSQVTTARGLMTYLRLHPYTGRPCLGLVHFVRRQNYCVERVTGCRWFCDLAKGMPSSWSNEVCDELRYVGRRIVHVSTRSCLDHFEVCLKSFPIGKTLTIVVPFQDVIDNLATNNPILLASLLCETVTNRYSHDLHNFLLDFIDFQLPGSGEDERRFWRQPLFGEMPRLEFLKLKSSKYRGPIYRSHRFFSGKYFQAVFSLTANSDLRIELGAPIDGNFWGHVYSGDQIVIDISKDELRAFVAKISTKSSLVVAPFFGNIRLLHPNNWIELFPLLLDLIILPDEKVSPARTADDEVIVEETRDKKQLKAASAKVKYIMDKFNNWALTTKGKCDPLSDQVVNSVTSKVEGLDAIEPWSLEFYKDSASRKLVEVRSGVWACRDVDRYYGIDERTLKSQVLREMVLSDSGAKAKDGFNQNKSVIVGTSGTGEMSFWSVRLLTDESKLSYLMDLRVVDDNNSSVQRFLGNEEARLMAAEEKLSLRYGKVESKEERRLFIMRQIEVTRNRIKNGLGPSLKVAHKQRDLGERKLRAIGVQFCDAIDSWMTTRSRLVYQNACKTFDLLSDDLDLQLVFNPSLFSVPEPLALKSEPLALKSESQGAGRKQSTMRKSSVVVSKEPTNDWEKLCQAVKVSGITPLNKELVVFVKRFEKIIAGFNADATTRTDAQVRLIVSNKFHGPISKREVDANSNWSVKFALYSSAWFPRYDPTLTEHDVATSFRDPGQWVRMIDVNNGRQPQRNETRVLNSKGRMLLVSDPVVGPFDVVGFTLYDSTHSRSWSVVVASSGDFPKFGHIPHAQRTLKEKEEAAAKSKKKGAVGFIVIDNGRPDLQPLYRLCAERLVWTVMTKSTLSVLIKSNVKEIASQVSSLEEQLDDSMDHLDALEEELDSVVSDSQEDARESSDEIALECDLAPITNENIAIAIHKEPETLEDAESKPAKKGVIQEIAPHSIENFHGTGIKVFGIMIPADEALEGIVIEVFSQDWLRVCEHYLGSGRLRRKFTSSAFIWSKARPSSSSYNPRIMRWIDDYDKNLGWKTTPYDRTRMKKLIRSEMKMHGTNEIEPYTSDVVLLLRYGDRELPLITAWLKDRFDEYAPIRELRLQKEGREREYRISNHQKFCKHVFDMAASFRSGLEAMFNERSSVNTELTGGTHYHTEIALSYFCRVLMSRFLSLRAASDGQISRLNEMTDSPTILDEAFLIDTLMVHPFENTLLRFDSLPGEEIMADRDGILLWDPTAFVEDPTTNPLLNRHDLQPRVGQVVYALYKMHCFECKLPSNLCKFPGCRCIRQEAAAIMQTTANIGEFFFDEVGGKLLELRGTGRHPIEHSVRRYMLSNRDLYNQLLPVIPAKPIGLSPADEIQLEQQIDDQEANRLRMIEYLRVTWKELELEACQFRYLGKRIIRPELSSVLFAEEVLDARGGLKGTSDESRLIGTWLESVRELVPRFSGHNMGNSEHPNSEVAKGSDNSASGPITGNLVEIPNSLMLGLLGGVGVDGRGQRVPLHLIDPYPGDDPAAAANKLKVGSKPGEVERPMAKVMFDWLIDHLSVSRPKRLPQSSGERGQYETAPATIKLDRLICEGATELLDGSMVMVQLLYGILSSSTLCADEISGTPPGAIRFCPSSLFYDLRPGLIIIVYDSRAGVTRCTEVEGRNLARAAEALQESETNIPAIARKVLEHSSLVIRLSRVGEMCTAVSLDINGIQRLTQIASRSETKVGRFRLLGRKESAFDKRRDRMRSAIARAASVKNL